MKAYTVVLQSGSVPLGLQESDEAAINAANIALSRYNGYTSGRLVRHEKAVSNGSADGYRQSVCRETQVFVAHVNN